MKPSPSSRRVHSWVVFTAATATAFLLLPAECAQAHTTFPGLGEVASGLLHPLTTPPHLLVLLALGLWLGQNVPLRLKKPAIAVALAAAVGLAATTVGKVGGVTAPVLIAVGLCAGAGVASGMSPPMWVRLVACAVGAFLLGLDSGVDGGAGGMAVVKILLATWVSLILCVVNTAFYVSLLPPAHWVRIGIRVAGSWIVAIALLMLAFALRR